jgi:ATP-dependent helicase YprA (DUF1998 family)
VQRLPKGSERQDAFKQIGGFHRQVAALVAQAEGRDAVILTGTGSGKTESCTVALLTGKRNDRPMSL